MDNTKKADHENESQISLDGSLDNMFKVGDGFKISYKKSGKTQMVGKVVKVEDQKLKNTNWRSGGKKITVEIAWGNIHHLTKGWYDGWVNNTQDSWTSESIKGRTITLEETRILDHDLIEREEEDGPRVYSRGIIEWSGWAFEKYLVQENGNRINGKNVKKISGDLWINKDGNKWGSEKWEKYTQTKDHPEYKTYMAVVKEDARDSYEDLDDLEKDLLALSLGALKD